MYGGITVLDFAVFKKKHKIVQRILQLPGIDPNYTTQGNTPLFGAVQNNDIDVSLIIIFLIVLS